MRYPQERNIHRPPHISLPNTCYFISARTYYSLPFLKERKAKVILKESFDKAVEKFGLELLAWVVLDNHYHWMFRSPGDNTLQPEADPPLAEKGVSLNFGNTLKRVTPDPNNTLKRVTPDPNNTLKRVSLDLNSLSSQNDNLPAGEAGLQLVTSPVKSFNIGKVVGYVHGRSSHLINKFRREESEKYLYDFTPRELGILKTQFAGKLGSRYEDLEDERTREFERLLGERDIRGLAKFVEKVSKIWYQYTDHIVGDEGDFYRHLNYGYQNPVKHGYVKDMLDYEFSSIHGAIRRRGKGFVLGCFSRYPVVDFNPSFEDW
ncbi:hypothetical protein L6258_02070 [Candidatus Parcubacteria bacterium]|nr:hypothetical protein [Candidatus Parcubacteria bacterium]